MSGTGDGDDVGSILSFLQSDGNEWDSMFAAALVSWSRLETRAGDLERFARSLQSRAQAASKGRNETERLADALEDGGVCATAKNARAARIEATVAWELVGHLRGRGAAKAAEGRREG